MAEPTRSWTTEEMQGDAVTKKNIAEALLANASVQFQVDNMIKMNVKNVAKNKTKDQLIELYNKLFDEKAFKQDGEEEAYQAKKAEESKLAEKTAKLDIKDSGKGDGASAEVPKFTKRTLSKGTSKNKPMKGDTVAVHYTGTLENGTVFDSSLPQGKKLNEKSKHKAQPLKFKVGQGKVIRGWDEALLDMCIGEKAEVKIEAAWAYGKKSVDGPYGTIPPNSNLIFEMELMNIE